MSCGVGPRGSSDLVLLWLWRRLAATALIGPLAWESPYAVGAATEKKKKKKKKELFGVVELWVIFFFYFSLFLPKSIS